MIGFNVAEIFHAAWISPQVVMGNLHSLRACWYLYWKSYFISLWKPVHTRATFHTNFFNNTVLRKGPATLQTRYHINNHKENIMELMQSEKVEISKST